MPWVPWVPPDRKVTRVPLEAPAPLEHQEHTALVLDPGDYQVVRQREYSPDAIRRVED